MTKAETKRLLQIMAALYPNWKPGDLDLTVEAWASVLEDENADTMAKALKIYAKLNSTGFAPSPGQLRDMKWHVEFEEIEAMLTAKIYGLPETEAAKMIGG